MCFLRDTNYRAHFAKVARLSKFSLPSIAEFLRYKEHSGIIHLLKRQHVEVSDRADPISTEERKRLEKEVEKVKSIYTTRNHGYSKVPVERNGDVAFEHGGYKG